MRAGDHWLPAGPHRLPPGPRRPARARRAAPRTATWTATSTGACAPSPGVWAAGDGVAYPIKQGGLAAQQADAVAADIARLSGAPTRPRPFRPVLRGLLRTATGPIYLRRSLVADDGGTTVAREPLWWPPSKVASRRLATHLARLDVATAGTQRLPGGGFALTAIR